MKVVAYLKHKIYVLLDKIQLVRRRKYLKPVIGRLKNKDLTLICNNCNGGVLLHELGLRFNSQFINLFVPPNDFIKYLERFDYYNGLEPKFIKDKQESYPVAVLEDVFIHFVHYKSEKEAYDKWEERKKRINKENMFIFFTQQKDCTKEILERFDALPFKNKVVFTKEKYSDIKSGVYVKGYEDNSNGVDMLLGFKNRFIKYRNYDVFDFVSWFNGETDLDLLDKQRD